MHESWCLMKPGKHLRKGSGRDTSRLLCVPHMSLVFRWSVHETPLPLRCFLSAGASPICLQVCLVFGAAFSSERSPTRSPRIFMKPPSFPLLFLLLERIIRDISPSPGCSPFPPNARIACSPLRSTSHSPFRGTRSRTLSPICLPAEFVRCAELRTRLPLFFHGI